MKQIEIVGRKGNGDNQFEVTLRGDVESVVSALVNGVSLDSLRDIATAIDRSVNKSSARTK